MTWSIMLVSLLGKAEEEKTIGTVGVSDYMF